MPRELYESIRATRRAAMHREVAVAIPPSQTQIDLEVGCGNGHFLTAYAAAHPATFCVGVDRRQDRIEKARRKQQRAGLANLFFFRGDALDLLQELPAAIRLGDVYMLFPDPWPKKRHHKNRLLNVHFLDAIAERAGQGSRLFFRTDFEPYYITAVATVAAHPRWRLLPLVSFPFEHVTIFQSRAASYFSLAAARFPAPVSNRALASGFECDT